MRNKDRQVGTLRERPMIHVSPTETYVPSCDCTSLSLLALRRKNLSLLLVCLALPVFATSEPPDRDQSINPDTGLVYIPGMESLQPYSTDPEFKYVSGKHWNCTFDGS